MLIYNVKTTDGLTNGACGYIIGIECTNERVDTIIVEFDDDEAGTHLQSLNPSITKKYGAKATPIKRISLEYSCETLSKEHSTKYQLIQFPLRLAWALTTHKIQGQTIKDPKAVGLDINTTFGPAQAYVMLGRTENLEQLHLADFDEAKYTSR